MIVRTLALALVAVVVSARIENLSSTGSLSASQRQALSQSLLQSHSPPAGTAPGGFGPGSSQLSFQQSQQIDSPPPGAAPGGFGPGSSQLPFQPSQLIDSPPGGSAPAGSGAGSSQLPFQPPERPGHSGAGASQDLFQQPQHDTGFPIQILPDPSEDVIPILVDEREGPYPDGSYRFTFETGNGISRYEQGIPQSDTGAVDMRGGWSFTFPDGTPAIFSFVADDTGYRAVSDWLPTPHPFPAHAIAQIEFARQQEAEAAAAEGRQ
ncbi:pupal cuticle protein 20-like [Cherax quadricarinatus]|uniref:pupal cuticle protein 20-like n=1 Tax=Cherax quadricarinatus TaxID=27406 RepID=UPI00387E50FA